MKNLKRIDNETILIEGVYYSTMIDKKIEVIGESGAKIDSVRINCVYYYPYKVQIKQK